MFNKKVSEKAIFKDSRMKDLNWFTQTTTRTGNISATVSYINVTFQREDQTLITLHTSSKKASKLMKDREGILTYRGGKFISFKPL